MIFVRVSQISNPFIFTLESSECCFDIHIVFFKLTTCIRTPQSGFYGGSSAACGCVECRMPQSYLEPIKNYPMSCTSNQEFNGDLDHVIEFVVE